MFEIQAALRRLVAAALGVVILTGFGPAPQTVLEQIGASPGVSVAIATLDGDRSHVVSYGSPFDGDSPFEIGSITKTFTATLFADMIVKREVRPDDPIERYLPRGVTAPTFKGRHITLGDLATQSSGLPRMPTNFKPSNLADPYGSYDDANMLAFLTSYALTRAPGAAFEYSNLGFGLLGYLLARRLGLSYTTAIRTRILEPLGMSHTGFEAGGLPAKTVRGHDADGDPVSNWRFSALAGAGAIVSTPNDMLRYARANLDAQHGLLAPAMQLAHRATRDAQAGQRIGYAWITRPDGIVWHNGGTAGFRSFLGLDVANRRAIVVLANGAIDAVDALGLSALDPTVPLPPPPTPDYAVAPDVLVRYVGRYRFRDDSVATVQNDRRGLSIVFDRPSFRARLHAVSADVFTIRSPHVDVRFEGTGSDARIVIMQAGEPPDTGKRVS